MENNQVIIRHVFCGTSIRKLSVHLNYLCCSLIYNFVVWKTHQRNQLLCILCMDERTEILFWLVFCVQNNIRFGGVSRWNVCGDSPVSQGAWYLSTLLHRIWCNKMHPHAWSGGDFAGQLVISTRKLPRTLRVSHTTVWTTLHEQQYLFHVQRFKPLTLKIIHHGYNFLDGFTDCAAIHSFIPTCTLLLKQNFQEIR